MADGLARLLAQAVVFAVVSTTLLCMVGGLRLVTRAYRAAGRAILRGGVLAVRILFLLTFHGMALLARLVGRRGNRERCAEAWAIFIERAGEAVSPPH